MATDTYKKLYQGQLGTSATTLYTVAAATQTVIRGMRIVNTSGVSTTVKLWHDGTSDAFVILPAVTIGTGEWAEFDGVVVMETGDTLSGQAGAVTSITLTVYGVEIT